MDRHEWDERYAAEGLLWHAEPNRFLEPEVADLTPGHALDLACGEGRNALWLAEHGWEVTGVDFSEVAIGKARQLAGERGVAVEWILADVLEWEPPRAAFDLVVVMYLQLPADERRLVLGRLPAAVSPGGTVLVVGHDVDNLTRGRGGPKDASVLLTAGAVADELVGLDVVRAEQVLRPVDDAVAVDTLVKAVRRPDV